IDATERFLCIASNEQGQDFLRQCAEMGVRPTLLTLDSLRDADWPLDALEELATMPAGLNREQILNTVSWMARGRRYDRIIALDELDLETAAAIREHLRVPGMGCTTASCYRDRLAMRVIAQALGFLVPEFCRVLNYDELRAFMDRVGPPWLLKPRRETRRDGWTPRTRRIDEPEQLWRALDELGDEQSRTLLDQFVPGDVFHADSIVSDGEVKFQTVYRFGRTPLENPQEGSVFTSQTVSENSDDGRELSALNRSLAPALGMVRGVTHGEYIRARADGRSYFLEIGAAVHGAFIADLVETGTGINLWREWARIEVAKLRGEAYVLPDPIEACAGSVLCTAHSAAPDATVFDAPEIVLRVQRHLVAGLIVRSSDPE
ncbi:MAG: ATP-grasp domain-containing protein, partial [Bryobacteraceae bacterium]